MENQITSPPSPPVSIQWPWQRIARWLLVAVSLVMLVHTLIYFAFAVAVIPFPFDYDQAEGFELNNAVLLAQGNCPYCDNDTYPFYGSGYPPLFHILIVPFVWVFGPAFWYGRLIIFLATLITAGAIAYAVRRTTQHTWIAIISGAAFLASNYIYHIGPLLRQHLLMVMFETLAVVILATAFDQGDKGRRWRLLLGFALLLVAGYTKQLAYTTCIAVALWVFLRNPRTALIYSIGLGSAAALIFAGALLITDGQWWINIIRSNQNPYITEQFTGLLMQFIRLHWPLLIMSSGIVLADLYTRRLSLYSIWFVVSLASTVGAGKWGAGDSYFATTLAAACILSGLFIGTHAARIGGWPRPALMPFVRTGGIVLLLVYSLTVIKFPTSGPIFGPLSQALNIQPTPDWRYPLYDAAGWTVGYAVTGHFPSVEDYENGWRIVDRVRAVDTPIISEDAGFSFLADKEVVTNAVHLNNLWENDLYDPTELITMIENHDFGLVILRARFFPPPVMIAIETHYRLDETIDMNGFAYELWVPNRTG